MPDDTPPGSSLLKPPLPLLRLHRLLRLLRGPLLPRLHFTSASPSPQSSFILSPVAPPLFSTSLVAFIQFSFTTAGPHVDGLLRKQFWVAVFQFNPKIGK